MFTCFEAPKAHLDVTNSNLNRQPRTRHTQGTHQAHARHTHARTHARTHAAHMQNQHKPD